MEVHTEICAPQNMESVRSKTILKNRSLIGQRQLLQFGFLLDLFQHSNHSHDHVLQDSNQFQELSLQDQYHWEVSYVLKQSLYHILTPVIGIHCI